MSGATDMVAMAMADAVGSSLCADKGPLSLVREVENGLPLAALDRVARAYAPNDAGFVYRIVPKATLARRRKARDGGLEGRLTAEESAKVARLAAVWDMAMRVWQDEDAARRFLFGPHMLLEMRPAVDVVLANEFGRPLVENILGGILYGTAV